MNRLLARLSAEQLRDLLAAKKRMEKAEPLKRKRAKLLKAAAKLQKKIDRLLSGASAGPGRSRKRAPGFPKPTRAISAWTIPETS